MRSGFAVTPSVRAAVTVTFLRLDKRPVSFAPLLPETASVVRLARPTIGFYRFLYESVGASYLWWLRRALPDSTLAGILNDAAVGVYVLYLDGEPGGFFELDARSQLDVNISYFGLMPHLVGKGIGRALLHNAVEKAFKLGIRGITVNTCTADHERAMPTYLKVGFRPLRSVQEFWDIPLHLGIKVPARLRA